MRSAPDHGDCSSGRVVACAAVNELQLKAADGVVLEARWDLPETDPIDSIVFCHPHPLHGGTMTAPLMAMVTSHLVAAGHAVLRFNFRGVGDSGGGWGGGIDEINDVAAAMSLARETATRASIIGWSFGAAAALRWQARDRDASAYVGIAPPVRDPGGNSLPPSDVLPPASRSIIIGERDQLISVDDVRTYASAIGAGFEVIPAADHFFHFREERLAEMVVSALD